MVIAFGLSCCSAAVLSPVAATDRAIAVIVSFRYFMVFPPGLPLRPLHRHAGPYRRATAERWQDGEPPARSPVRRRRNAIRSDVAIRIRPKAPAHVPTTLSRLEKDARRLDQRAHRPYAGWSGRRTTSARRQGGHGHEGRL